MRVMICGHRWRLIFPDYVGGRRGWHGHKGECDPNTSTLKVRRDLRGLLRLDTTIHEFQHAAHPTLSEDHVNKSSTDLARLLYALGYRQVIEP